MYENYFIDIHTLLLRNNATTAKPSSPETGYHKANDNSAFVDIGASEESQPGLSYSNTEPDLIVELEATKPPNIEKISPDEEIPEPASLVVHSLVIRRGNWRH